MSSALLVNLLSFIVGILFGSGILAHYQSSILNIQLQLKKLEYQKIVKKNTKEIKILRRINKTVVKVPVNIL